MVGAGADAQTQRVNEAMVALDGKSLALNRRMRELGEIKGLPVVQAQAELDGTRGTVAAGRSQLVLDRNALRLLVGQEIPDELLPRQALPGQSAVLLGVPGSLPSRVLQQRPDVLQAEHAQQQAQLDIVVARAAFFPTTTLSGNAGTGSTDLAGLFKSGNCSWNFGPSLSLPVFNAGSLQASLDAAKSSARRPSPATTKPCRPRSTKWPTRWPCAARWARASRHDGPRPVSTRPRCDPDALFRNGSVSYLDVLTAQRSLYSSQQAEIALDLSEQDNRLTP
jgi:multidrug efflux system outer membrane protein